MQKVIKDVFQDFKKESNIQEAQIQKMNLYKKSNKLEVDILSQIKLKFLIYAETVKEVEKF